MTDKQIIIDGIDVSECECIIEDYQRANNFEGRYEHIKNVCELGERGAEYYNLFCKDNPNCFYKQLKRKEQECGQLKKTIQLQNKMQEEVCNEKNEEIETLRKINKANAKSYEKFWHKLEQYKQVLIEIKNVIGDRNKDGEAFCDDRLYKIEQILQICDEVNNANIQS